MTLEQDLKLLMYRDGPVIQARVLGPVNRAAETNLDPRLAAAITPEVRTVALDLGGAEYVDSDGIRWLQRMQQRLEEEGVELRLAVRERSRAERTLNLLKLQETFRIERYPADTHLA